jgi:hypothetical protein
MRYVQNYVSSSHLFLSIIFPLPILKKIVIRHTAVDEYEPNFIGSYVVQSFNDYEGEAIILTVSDESPMYRYCNQSLLDRIAFPAIPRFQGELKWMSSEQEKYTEIFGWVSLLIITIVTVNLAYSFGYNLTSKKKKVRSDMSHLIRSYCIENLLSSLTQTFDNISYSRLVTFQTFRTVHQGQMLTYQKLKVISYRFPS